MMPKSPMRFEKLIIASPKRTAQAQQGWEGVFSYYAGYPESFARALLRSANLPVDSVVLGKCYRVILSSTPLMLMARRRGFFQYSSYYEDEPRPLPVPLDRVWIRPIYAAPEPARVLPVRMHGTGAARRPSPQRNWVWRHMGSI